VRSLRRDGAASPARTGHDGSGLSRREILTGGIGAGALIALPDIGLGGRPGRQPLKSGGNASRHAFLYGMTDPGASLAASVPGTAVDSAAWSGPGRGQARGRTGLVAGS